MSNKIILILNMQINNVKNVILNCYILNKYE